MTRTERVVMLLTEDVDAATAVALGVTQQDTDDTASLLLLDLELTRREILSDFVRLFGSGGAV